MNNESRGDYGDDDDDDDDDDENNNNDDNKNNNNKKKFKKSMISSGLYYYSDAYILAKGTTKVPNTAAEGGAVNNTNKKLIFKICAPFTSCITELNEYTSRLC